MVFFICFFWTGVSSAYSWWRGLACEVSKSHCPLRVVQGSEPQQSPGGTLRNLRAIQERWGTIADFGGSGLNLHFRSHGRGRIRSRRVTLM